MEVEILVAEVGLEPAGDQMFHILYDGTVVDAHDIAAIGGDAEAIKTRLADTWTEGLDRSAAIRIGAAALAGADRQIPAGDLEVAELARTNGRRCFHRLTTDALDDRTALIVEVPPWSPSISTATSENRSAPGASATTSAMLPIVTSANVACGFHAGDPTVMRTVCTRGGVARRGDRCPGVVPGPRRASDVGSSTWRPTNCAMPCSTNSGRSTRSPRSPAPRSRTSSRTVRSTTRSPASASSPTPWSPPPSTTTRRSPSWACRIPNCSRLPIVPGWKPSPRRSPIVRTGPTAASCHGGRRARCSPIRTTVAERAIRFAVDRRGRRRRRFDPARRRSLAVRARRHAGCRGDRHGGARRSRRSGRGDRTLHGVTCLAVPLAPPPG